MSTDSLPGSATRSAHEVEISGVVKRFGGPGGEVVALAGIDLAIGAGEFVSVIGPSGCGKSTLLRVVAGLLEQDAGTVRIGGRSPAAAAQEKIIGLVPQAPALLPWRTVRENVLLPIRVNRRANVGRSLRDVDEMLVSFGLGDALERYPAQLSGGMQQRVAIARAFVADPEILLMDEPFSALDEIHRERQRIGLQEFWQSHRTSAMLVTHSVPEAIMLSDRIVIMAPNPGRILEIVDVELPRPRAEAVYASEAYRELEARVRAGLRAAMGEPHD